MQIRLYEQDDWAKGYYWSALTVRGELKPVETLPELLDYCKAIQVTLREFMAMPNARAMPADLRAAAERELAR